MLSEEQGRTLLRLARQTLEEELGQQPTDPVAPDLLRDPDLRRHQGIFVTLSKEGMLRGCIGSLLGVESIVDGVRRHAVNAALHDHRFSMLSRDELPEVRIEISVLTPPENLAYTDGNDLIRQLRPRIDGVILKKGAYGATFLPQVWQQLPKPKIFLEHLCRKAGLPADCWQSGALTVQTYQAQHFEEQGKK